MSFWRDGPNVVEDGDPRCSTGWFGLAQDPMSKPAKHPQGTTSSQPRGRTRQEPGRDEFRNGVERGNATLLHKANRLGANQPRCKNTVKWQVPFVCE